MTKVRDLRDESFIGTGSDEAMENTRKEHLPQFTREIENFLGDYQGHTVCITKVKDVGDGGIGLETMITGLDRPLTMMALSDAVAESAKQVINMLSKSLPEDAFDALMEEFKQRKGEK